MTGGNNVSKVKAKKWICQLKFVHTININEKHVFIAIMAHFRKYSDGLDRESVFLFIYWFFFWGGGGGLGG